jgi:hypothetical protein
MSPIRDALFEHEMFLPRGGGWYPVEHIRRTKATWEFTKAQTESELSAMCAEHLLTVQQMNQMHGGNLVTEPCFAATAVGHIEREKRWQELKRRHPALLAQEASTRDLVLGLLVSVGTDPDEQAFTECFWVKSLYVYLWFRTRAEIDTAIEELMTEGLIREADPMFATQSPVLAPTSEGRIYCARRLVPRLGLVEDHSMLKAPDAAPAMFLGLGLPPIITDNLQFRWEEAQRCRSAGAWLALTVMHGSILEALLVPSLEGVLARAMTSTKAPRDKSGNPLPVKDWKLEALLNVAADIGLVEPTLAKYGHALRDARNLVHPEKQIRERSQPDETVTDISGRVVRGVVESLLRNKAHAGSP